jgi:hypothetical protein
MKFLSLLSNVISEQKRYKLQPETYTKLLELTDKLWATRNKNYDKLTLVDKVQFKTAKGDDGMVRIYIRPSLKYIGLMDTRPTWSTDPMDFIMQLNPKKYGSKKNLFLTIYHEMMHATDPTQSTEKSARREMGYNPEIDEKYWGNPIEFRAITNEFLEALVNEFKLRVTRLRNQSNKITLKKSLDNIVNHFAKNEPLSKVSLDILSRMNDELITDNRFSKVLSKITMDYPETSELLPKKQDEPYFLYYVKTIQRYNPKIWPKFLTMLYKTKEEIEELMRVGG